MSVQHELAPGLRDSRGCRGRARTALAGGEGPAAAGLRARGRSVLRARAALGARRRRGRPRRAGRDRRRGQRDPPCDRRTARRRAGALRDARRAPVRHPTRPADRGDGSRPASRAPRRVPRGARGRAARPAHARGCRHPPGRGARPLGAGALPARPVPLRAAPLGPVRAAGRDLAAARGGPARAGARAAIAPPRGARRARRARASRTRRRRTRSGGRSSRPCHGDREALTRELDGLLLGVGARPALRRVCARPPTAPAYTRSIGAADPPHRRDRLRRWPTAARARGAR